MTVSATAQRSFRSVLADFVQISKPRILGLLLVVAWAAMFVAAGGIPDPVPFVTVSAAGACSVAAAGALNNVVERRRDARMDRTANRPLAAGRISVAAALAYAGIMSLLAFLVLAAAGLVLAATLTLGAIAYYVVVYTILLKPSTPQNIVIGGLAGSFPAVIGWTAVTQSLAWPAVWPALAIAALVFLWTPPHFWALALVYKTDYEAAGFPMMPNVRGEASTRRQIVAYAVLTAAASFLVVPAAGWAYLVGAMGLGFLLMFRSVRLLRHKQPAQDRAYFLFTIQYLGILLLVLMADRVVVSAWPSLGL